MRTPVQLGWIQSAINYVFDKVINPIFSWVTNLLSDVFKWVFNNILGPLLETAFSLIAQTVGKYIMRVLGRLFYFIEKCFLLMLDMMQSIFNVLAGTQPVSDKQLGLEGSLLSVLVRTPFVTKAMLMVIAISFALTFLFAIVATIKSIGDMGGPQSRPVGQVMRKLAQAMLRMITAPVLGVFLVFLGDAVLASITNAMTMDRNVTIARSLFVISSLDAVDDEFGAVDKYGVKHKGDQRLSLSFSNQYVSGSVNIGNWDNPILGYNYSTRPQYLAKHQGEASDYGMRDLYREPFYTGEKDYASSVDVDATFNVGRLDYFVGIGGSLLFIFVLGSALFTFTSRIFDVIVLLIIEPLFLAPMPLDDGEHFQKWEDMFIGKLFSGYGMVVAMYLYLLVCSMVFDGRISFTPRNDMGDIMMDMLMRMIVLLGGAATIMTAGPLVTSIISSAAAGQETAAMSAGMAFTGGVAMKPLSFAGGLALDYASDKIAEKFGGKKPEPPGGGNDDLGSVLKDENTQKFSNNPGNGPGNFGGGGGSGNGGTGPGSGSGNGGTGPGNGPTSSGSGPTNSGGGTNNVQGKADDAFKASLDGDNMGLKAENKEGGGQAFTGQQDEGAGLFGNDAVNNNPAEQKQNDLKMEDIVYGGGLDDEEDDRVMNPNEISLDDLLGGDNLGDGDNTFDQPRK